LDVGSAPWKAVQFKISNLEPAVQESSNFQFIVLIL